MEVIENKGANLQRFCKEEERRGRKGIGEIKKEARRVRISDRAQSPGEIPLRMGRAGQKNSAKPTTIA